jgi:hypothetical protein
MSQLFRYSFLRPNTRLHPPAAGGASADSKQQRPAAAGEPQTVRKIRGSQSSNGGLGSRPGHSSDRPASFVAPIVA